MDDSNLNCSYVERTRPLLFNPRTRSNVADVVVSLISCVASTLCGMLIHEIKSDMMMCAYVFMMVDTPDMSR